jgi:hypothetical protein
MHAAQAGDKLACVWLAYGDDSKRAGTDMHPRVCFEQAQERRTMWLWMCKVCMSENKANEK